MNCEEITQNSHFQTGTRKALSMVISKVVHFKFKIWHEVRPLHFLLLSYDVHSDFYLRPCSKPQNCFFKTVWLIDKIFLHRLPKVIDILYQKWNCKYGGHIITCGCWFLYPFFLGHTIVSQIYSLIVVIQTNTLNYQQAHAHNFHSFTRVANQELAQANLLIDLHGSGQIFFSFLFFFFFLNSIHRH